MVSAGDLHGAGSTISGGGSATGTGDDGLAGSWGRSGYDPLSMGIQSGIDDGESPSQRAYAESYAKTLGAEKVRDEQGFTTYADKKGNVWAMDPATSRMMQIGAPSLAGGTMQTPSGARIGRGAFGVSTPAGLHESFPQTYRDSRYDRQEGVRQQFREKTDPLVRSQILDRYYEDVNKFGASDAIRNLYSSISDLEAGRVGSLEERGFDVGNMRELQGKGAFGKMAEELGFDVDEYANPMTTLKGLVESGAVEFNPETGEYEETGKLATMAGGFFLENLAGLPGLSRVAYEATGSIPAALSIQAGAQLAGDAMQGGKPSSTLQQSVLEKGLKMGLPQTSKAVDFVGGPGMGLKGMMDYMSQLQAAGIRPTTEDPKRPLSEYVGGESRITLAQALSERQPDQRADQEYIPMLGQSFYTNPYSGNLAGYYRMFGNPLMA